MNIRRCLEWIVIFALNYPVSGYAANNNYESEFEQYIEESEQGFALINEEFEVYKKSLLKAFDDYKQKTVAIWGKKAQMPTPALWVSFQGDLKHRSIVDFEQGLVDVSFVIDREESLSDSEIEKKLKQQAKALLQQGKDTRSIREIAEDPVSQSTGAAILIELVELPAASNMSIDETLVVESQQVVGKDGKRRTIYRTWFELLPDHIHRRAIKYEADILLQAGNYKITSELVYAIMETESMFNPMARSPVPAFGLMQLVPNSGAREAYRYVYNTDKIVTDEYLYNPEKNIELGAAYLNRLYYRYLRFIKDPVSRQWASIAAYNTGVGNVYRVFAGKYSTGKYKSRKAWRNSAFYEINKMDSEQVYDFMQKNLPYKETRHYLKKVRERMNKYKTKKA